jgi:hypothetical protein
VRRDEPLGFLGKTGEMHDDKTCPQKLRNPFFDFEQILKLKGYIPYRNSTWSCMSSASRTWEINSNPWIISPIEIPCGA